jgi:hypothetical protein
VTQFSRHPLVRFLSSLPLTVAALLLLALLTACGTVYQATHGLYAAQAAIFHSCGFLAFGFLPVPGILLAGAVLLVNLLLAMLFRLRWRLAQAGLILIHLGLLLFLGGGYLSLQVSEESFLTLREGESSSFASAYHEWELAVWQPQGETKRTAAVDADGFRPGDWIAMEPIALRLQVRSYFRNSVPERRNESQLPIGRPLSDDPAADCPGGTWMVESGRAREIFSLFGSDPEPRTIRLGDRILYAQLRLKRLRLPVSVTLIDFRKTLYPGSEIPRSFESRVAIEGAGIRRDALISMNKPLRIREFTFYQSSYEEGGSGPDRSTFAVVRNSGRFLPYGASAVLFLGLCLHFVPLAFARRRSPT